MFLGSWLCMSPVMRLQEYICDEGSYAKRSVLQIVTEFFGFACNSILYQRGIYPPESFAPVAKYGLSLLVTTDEGLKTYLAQVLRQVAGMFQSQSSTTLIDNTPLNMNLLVPSLAIKGPGAEVCRRDHGPGKQSRS